MNRTRSIAVALASLALIGASSVAHAEESATAPIRHAAKPSASAAKNAKDTKGEAKALSGMSILGNQEAPKALVIVPWKSSQLGETLDISKTLDDSRQPVDKEVFLRELSYYEIRTNSK